MADNVIFCQSLPEAFKYAGMPYPEHEPEAGKLARFPTNERDRNDRAGWCKLFPDEDGAAFGDWRTGDAFTWQRRDTSAPPPSQQERTQARQRAEQARQQAEQEREAGYTKTAGECAALWDTLDLAPAGHAYLKRKGIAPHLARLDTAGRLVLPVFDADGEIQSLQAIAADGGKRFHPGGKMTGGRLMLGRPADGSPLVLVEGFATGASIHEAAGVVVAVGFAGSNLRHAAESLRRLFPRSPLLVAGDMDAHGAGRKYAQAAAEAAQPARVAFPVFKDGRPTGDFNDLAQAEGPETIRRQILDALRPPAPAFPFAQVGELLTGPKSARWLVRGWIEAGSVALLFGESTAGKSFQALDWCACIATGTPWNGCAVQHGPVFYIAGEGKGGIGRRLAAWEAHHGTRLANAPLFVSERAAALMDAGEALSIGQAVGQLSDRYGPPALVVVDTLHRNMGSGDENSAEDFAAFLANIDRAIREPLGCAVLLVHHSGHADKTRSRGSSAIRAALDAEFSLTMDGDTLRKLECTKQKDSEPPEALTLEARSVALPEPWVDEETGEPLTSLVLVPTEAAGDTMRRANLPVGGNQGITWRELGPMFCNSRDFAQGGAPNGRPCLKFEDAITAVKGKLPCETDRQHERAKAAIRGLVGRGLLAFGEGWVWCK